MKKPLLIEGAIYVSVLTLASFLWRQPAILLFCLVIISALMLLRWHRRSDVTFYGAGFVLGPLGEAMAVHFGAWEYSKPLFLVPVWLPCLWGVAALFVKRLCDTLLQLSARRDSTSNARIKHGPGHRENRKARGDQLHPRPDPLHQER